MRLRALTGLEREKLEAEYAELMEKIRKYEAILADRTLLLRVIREEILAVSEKYGDDRKTSIGYDVYDIRTEAEEESKECRLLKMILLKSFL